MIAQELALIAVDWGTSNFRAFLLNHAGNILETRSAKQGLLHVADSDFATTLTTHIADCLENNPDIPIVMCGMVGSRQGWQEVPYLMCPIVLNKLADHLQRVKNQSNTWIIPGLRIDYPDGRIDVMRGEETQILGSLDFDTSTSQLFCLPGTHTKWAWIESGKLVRFQTFMSGEIFSLLFKQSILGRGIEQKELHIDALNRGIEWSHRPEHLLSQLFQVRTQMLAGHLALDDVNSFLSGLLLGHEISAVLTEHIHQRIHIVSSSRVAQRYAEGLKKYQLQTQIMDAEQVTARGIFRIAQQAGLIP